MKHFSEQALRAAAFVVFLATQACGGGGDGGHHVVDLPDTYVPAEVCNGIDDDFDTVVDDGAACALSGGVIQASCVAGACKVDTCATGTANCDNNFATGCEVPTLLDRLHCGGCAPCANGSQCVEGTCVGVTTYVAGGTGDQSPNRIVDRGAGLFAIAGQYKSNLSLGGNTVTDTTKDHGFVWGFSSSFANEWLVTLSSPTSMTYGQTVNVSDLEVGADGALYYSGSYRTSVTNGTGTVTESNSSGGSYLGKLTSSGNSSWFIAPDMPGTALLAFSYPVDILVGPTDVRLAGNYSESQLGGGPIWSFFNRYDTSGTQLSQNYTGYNVDVTVATAITYGTGTLVFGRFDGYLEHGAATPNSLGNALYAAEFTDVGNDGALVLVRNTQNMEDGAGGAVAIGTNAYAVTHYVEGQGTLRAFDASTERWAMPLLGVESPLLLHANGQIYMVTRTRVGMETSLGTAHFDASTTANVLIVVLNATTGAVERAGRIAVGGINYLADAVLASDGKLWLTGPANGIVNGTTTMGTDVLVMSINVAQIP